VCFALVFSLSIKCPSYASVASWVNMYYSLEGCSQKVAPRKATVLFTFEATGREM
jgi:hypothetical protein